nr:MAG TPA: hypothetical protein [Caudoviricetes sp.]
MFDEPLNLFRLSAHMCLLLNGDYQEWLIPFARNHKNYLHNDQLLYDFLFNLKYRERDSEFTAQLEAGVFTIVQTVRIGLTDINTLPMSLIQLYGVHMLDFNLLGTKELQPKELTEELSQVILFADPVYLLNEFKFGSASEVVDFNDRLKSNLENILNSIQSDNAEIKKRVENLIAALELFRSSIGNASLLVDPIFPRPKD